MSRSTDDLGCAIFFGAVIIAFALIIIAGKLADLVEVLAK